MRQIKQGNTGQTTLIDFHYLARYIAELKSFAGTGCLVCHDGTQQCLLYYQFGLLTHAQLGDKLGPAALSALLGWQHGQLHFQPRLTYASQSLTAEQEEIFMRTLSFLHKRRLLESPQFQASATNQPFRPGSSFQVSEAEPQVLSSEYVGSSAETQIVNFASSVVEVEVTREGSGVSSVGNPSGQAQKSGSEIGNSPAIASIEDELLAPVDFDLSEPPEVKAKGKLVEADSARSQTERAQLPKVFKLTEKFLPPANLLKLTQDRDFVAHRRSMKLDWGGLLKRAARDTENGYLIIDCRRNPKACYVRVFYYQGQLVEAAFDDGTNLVEAETALQRLFHAEPPLLSQIKLGKVAPGLLRAYFATQKAGRSLFTAIPAASLNVQERLTSLAQHHFSGVVKFYSPNRVIFYLMHEGEGLGGYEVQRGVLARVKTSLDNFVIQPGVLVDIYPGLVPQPLLMAEAPDLNPVTFV